MDQLHGKELSDAMFDFCQCFRELNLSESEFSLVLPLHACYYGNIYIYIHIDIILSL